MGLSCIGESVVNFLFSFRGGDIMPDFAYSGTLRNNHSQGKCPGCLLTAFPKSAIFHTYGSCALLESLGSPYFFAWSLPQRPRLLSKDRL